MMLLFVATLAATLLVQFWLKRTYRRWSHAPNTSNLTGFETARAIPDHNGLRVVRVEPGLGVLMTYVAAAAASVAYLLYYPTAFLGGEQE